MTVALLAIAVLLIALFALHLRVKAKAKDWLDSEPLRKALCRRPVPQLRRLWDQPNKSLKRTRHSGPLPTTLGISQGSVR